jgi:HemY protein
MRAIFWLMTLAALAIGVALLGRLSDGYVLAVVPPWRIELSLNLFVVGFLVLLFLLYLLLRGIAITLAMPRIVGDFRARRARQRDERTAAEALRLFWEGRYSHALKSAEKVGAGDTARDAGKASVAQGVAALVGLRAAHALRDDARIADWQLRAEALDEAGWRTARLMGDARIALDAHDYDAAAAALDQLGPKERRQISAQRLALRLARGRGDWAELLRLARQLEKHRALTPEQAQPLRLHAWHGMLDTLKDAPDQLMRQWRAMPEEDRRDVRLAQRTASVLAGAGACADSARLIEDCLDERWESDLLDIYAFCPGGDALARIAHCEKWLPEHPRDARLLIALGRLCMQRQLWGKAQSYLEAALAVDKTSCVAHLELARLLDQLEKPAEADRHYRAAAQCQVPVPQIQSRGGRKSL